MKDEITIDGTTYVSKDKLTADAEHVIVIAERGWIFIGYREDFAEERVGLYDADVVRKWANGLGIGGLVKAEHKDDYTLDPVGRVSIPAHSVIAIIPVEWQR